MRTDIDQVIVDAMNNFLRTCSSGGMDEQAIVTTRTCIEEAADHNYFALALSRKYNPANAAQADKEFREWLNTFVKEVVHGL